MNPWWQFNPQLSAEACSIICRGGLMVYEDNPHGCYHIMLGNDEWASVAYPWSEAAREELRRRAFIMHNDQSRVEDKQVKQENNDLISSSEKDEQTLINDIVTSAVNFSVKDHMHFVT